jgi:hypothetical protein
MAQTYRLVGAQDPTNRIDRWVVESPSDDYPEGKVLELGGDAVELSDRQYLIGSQFLRLEPTKANEEPTDLLVDQPGVERTSMSTDNPPDPGTVPPLEDMNRDQLRAEARRVGAEAPGNASKEDLNKAIQAKREEG